MEKTHGVYSIDNGLYNEEWDIWRQPDSPFYLMQSSVNPTRIGFFKRKLLIDMNIDPQGKTALEVGCGGGILTEEIGRMGFVATGIDPSEQSIKIATDHAKIRGLQISYETGAGEALPFRDKSFDIVFCCDFWSMCAMCQRWSRKYPAS